MDSSLVTQQPAAQPLTERIGRGVVRHWVGLLNGLLLLYAGLPWVSPLLRSWGYEQAGLVIYRMYRQFCHQLVERSFTLNGYPVCYCHRCTALYTTLLLMSLLYTVARWRQPVSHRVLALLSLPIVVDGTRHLLTDIVPALALRSAADAVGSLNFWLRMLTGTLFAVGVILWAYPRIEAELATTQGSIPSPRGS